MYRGAGVDSVYVCVDTVYVAEPLSDDLRDRLVQQALALLAERGLEGVSLRAIARRSGVSHGAPLRHFTSLADLLSEVAAVGFRLLSEAIEKSAAGLPPGAGPLARLRAGGRAYVESAVASPGLFALMFRPEALDPANASYRRHGGAAFEHLVGLVRAAQDAGWHDHRETRALAGAVWAALHGVATLWTQDAFAGPAPRTALEDLITTTLELLLSGQPGGTP